ncbi:MAG: GGDEF domain-containing protein [Opitutaceae bacterium]
MTVAEQGQRRILLIDDDQLQFRLTRAHFRRFRGEQFALDWEPTYGGGLKRLLDGGYAACMLDFQLSDHDGLELIREAVSRGCRTPIIFLTADSTRDIDIQAMDAGAFDFLVKGELLPAALERSLRYALKLAETLETLHRLATHDELTGLLNRREFQRVQKIEEERAQQFGHPLALLMLDLDGFKSVNDVHGHGVGDEVLRIAGRRIASAVRMVDYAGRIGGDEFAVLLVGTPREAALRVADRLREAVGAEAIVTSAAAVTLTASIGLAVFPEEAGSGGALLARVDQALYRAKAGGRNRVGGGTA